MLKMNRFFFGLICLFALGLLPCSAVAEEAPEKGFKITKDTVLNIGLSLNPEFESNIMKASEDTVTIEKDGSENKTEIVSDLILHYSPSLRIKLDDKEKTIGFSLLFDYNHYLGLEDSKSSKKLSDLDIRSDFLGEFNKSGLIIPDFKNSLSRSATPEGQEISGKHKNLLDSFTLGLAFKNVEDTLYGKINLGVDINYLEQSKDDAIYKDYNYVAALVDLFGRWKFLPRTMVFASASVRYQDYYESAIRDDSRAVPLNMFVGVMGQVTPYISSKLSAGYSVNIGEDVKHDYNANAELVFKYKDTGLTVGYLRNMRPSAYYQYSAAHKVYLKFRQKFAKSFLATLDFNYSYLSYGNYIEYKDREGYAKNSDGYYERVMTYDDGSSMTYTIKVPKGNRADHYIVLTPAFSYNILPWLGLKLNYTLEYKDTDFFREAHTVFSGAESYERTVKTHYDYIDHIVMLSIVLDY